MTAKKRGAAAKKKSATEETELSFEEALERLETLVERLEDGDVSLEDSLNAYVEGTKLVRQCQDRLRQAETLIQELSGNGNSLQVKDIRLGDGGVSDAETGEDDDDLLF